MFFEKGDFKQILIKLGQKPENHVKKIAAKSPARNVQNNSYKLYSSGSQAMSFGQGDRLGGSGKGICSIVWKHWQAVDTHPNHCWASVAEADV